MTGIEYLIFQTKAIFATASWASCRQRALSDVAIAKTRENLTEHSRSTRIKAKPFSVHNVCKISYTMDNSQTTCPINKS